MHPGPFLIVDDRSEIRVSLQRLLSLSFEQVLTAGTPGEAEVILEQRRPRFLLCDYWLGDDHPPGIALLQAWRVRYTSLERVALMSGSEIAAFENCNGIDRIFEKPLDFGQLLDFFGSDSKEAPR